MLHVIIEWNCLLEMAICAVNMISSQQCFFITQANNVYDKTCIKLLSKYQLLHYDSKKPSQRDCGIFFCLWRVILKCAMELVWPMWSTPSSVSRWARLRLLPRFVRQQFDYYKHITFTSVVICIILTKTSFILITDLGISWQEFVYKR